MKILSILLAAALLSTAAAAPAQTRTAVPTDYSVGPQYDTAHVYVPEGQFDAFITSLQATFGGSARKQGEYQVTPTPSLTKSQLVLTPAGSVSVVGFKTPIPAPFGDERTGYLVTDMGHAVASALENGATRLVTTFPDPIGRDVVIQWPGGVNMQLYWHTQKPDYRALVTIPENRVYLTADAADMFVRHWLAFSHGKVTADDRNARGEAIGQAGKTYRRIAITSGYGRMAVIVSDGHLPWPYGRDVTGYEVANLKATLAKANAAGVETLVPVHADADRQSAMVRFPGGYIAEIHARVRL